MYVLNKSLGEVSSLEITSFSDNEIREIQDLKKWIIKDPEILDEDLYIITSEYGRFDKTNERLDILAVDREGKLVVIALKLDTTGTSVEIQAIKYASYVSTLLLDDII